MCLSFNGSQEPTGKYATKLDHSIGHDTFKSREQNVSNNEDNRDYEAFVIFCYTKM